jgi:hypothetical protein
MIIRAAVIGRIVVQDIGEDPGDVGDDVKVHPARFLLRQVHDDVDHPV